MRAILGEWSGTKWIKHRVYTLQPYKDNGLYYVIVDGVEVFSSYDKNSVEKMWSDIVYMNKAHGMTEVE